MTRQNVTLRPVEGPSVWRGDVLRHQTDWIYELSSAERSALEVLGQRFVDDDPDLRTVTAADYPLGAAAGVAEETARQMDDGRGFILLRGLRSPEYGDAMSGAIFFILGLHLGTPMEQNQYGNLIDHVVATSDKTMDDPDALPSRVRDRLDFHSDSSDIVGLICLRGAREGGESSIVSGATIYNEVLRRRPDLAPMLFDDWHWDWRRQDPDAPANTYVSPICSDVEGTFSTYAGSTMIFTAQAYDEVPRLTDEQIELLHLYDEVTQEDGLPLDMEFQPGDVQWLLNYAALHSRTSYIDWPERERRRHLLRLWLRRDVERPLVPGFGKNVIDDQVPGASRPRLPGGAFRIGEAVVVNDDWGN